MNDAILKRLLTLITLRVDMRGKFKETVEFAAEAELAEAGVPRDMARTLAPLLAENVVARLELNREALRAVASAIGHPTPGCDCAGCRVIAWAHETANKKPPTDVELATQAAVREALNRAKHGEGGEKN